MNARFSNDTGGVGQIISEMPTGQLVATGRAIMDELAKRAGDPLMRLDKIVLREVAEKYGVAEWEILGCERIADLVKARKDVARRLKDAGWSNSRIGRALNRDHSTIFHYFRNQSD